MLLGFVIIGNCPGKIDIRRIRRLKYGYVKFFLWDGKPFRRSQQFPGVGNGFLLEVIAEGEIAKHLEERVVALGEADVFEVVVLAARAHAFLCGGRAGVIAFFEAQEHVLELVHPRIREQQRRVAMRHERRAAHAAVPLALEEAEERLADLIATPRFGVFPCAPYRGRFLFAGHTGLIGWSGRMHGLSQSLTVAAWLPLFLFYGGPDRRLFTRLPLFRINDLRIANFATPLFLHSYKLPGVCTPTVHCFRYRLTSSSRRLSVGVGLDFGEVVAGQGVEFAADYVGGEAGAEKTAVDGGHLPFVDLLACIGAAKGAQLALDSLAHDGGFVGFLGGFFEGGFNVAVGDAAGAQVASHAEFSLFARFGALPRELLRIPRVVNQPVFFQPSHHKLNAQCIVAPPFELFLHLVDGVRPPHQSAHRDVVQLFFGLKLARLPKHAGSIEAGNVGSKIEDQCSPMNSPFGAIMKSSARGLNARQPPSSTVPSPRTLSRRRESQKDWISI